nr:hypothetical protein [Sulfurimonas sp. SAG-AH-194-I05]
MQENTSTEKEALEPQEEVKFGYGASIVFLLFIGFIIYTTFQ